MPRGSGASDVAHAWAHGHGETMSRGNVFFKGRTIYSYGYHFPMAVLMDGSTVAVTKSRYSNTTAGHQSKVRGAISHKDILWCYRLPKYDGKFEASDHAYNIAQWVNEIKEHFEGLAKARKKSVWMLKISETCQEAQLYLKFFETAHSGHASYTLSKADRAILFNPDLDAYQAEIAKARAAEERKRKADIKKGQKLHPTWLKAWRNFKEADFNEATSPTVRQYIQQAENDGKTGNNVRLRVWKEGDGIATHVYTSKGIKVPTPVAERYYHRYMEVAASGGCSGDCVYKMMGYQVDEINEQHLLVGCHDIPRSEIEYVAGVLGWTHTPGAYAMMVNSDGNLEE